MTARRHLLLVVCLLVGTLVGAGGARTYALLSDDDQVSAGAFTAGSIVVPNPPQVTAILGIGTISWTATTVDTGAGAQPVSGYQVYRYAAQTGGAGTLVCTTTTRTSCPPSAGLNGFYAVRAVLAGTTWTAESSRTAPSLLGDATAPTVVHTSPTDNQRSSAPNLRTAVSAACGTGVACGTATDDVGVTSVTYTLERSTGGLFANRECWNGVAWSARPVLTGCAAQAAQVLVVGGVTTWRVPGTVDSAYPNNPAVTFTLAITARDAAANQAASTITYANRT